MQLVSKAHYAAYRGVSKAAVTKAIQDDRITGALVEKDGREMLDLEKADELWGKNTLRKASERKASGASSTRTAKGDIPEDAVPDLNESRARREHYLAEKAKQEALVGRGELVEVAAVKAEAFALARSLRDGLMRIPDRLSPILASTTDSRDVHKKLSDEIRIALRGLTDG